MASRAPISPLQIPRDVTGVMVLGGTFDPPHFYHTVGPWIACTRLLGPKGWLLYVPAARNPLKKPGPSAAAKHRLNMLRLALDIPGRRSIWTDEIDRAAWLATRGEAAPSYTIDTLRRLRSALRRRLGRDVPVRLLIGADQAAHFHEWKDYRRLLRLATPAVMLREPWASTPAGVYQALAASGRWTWQELALWASWIAPTFPLPASSTDLRAAIKSAPSRPGRWKKPPLDTVTTNVARYILKHGLYGAGR
ncbi:MAG: nicotinate-nicotinamide nucleotide adenylyltransferase [Phycisphaerae bacterium]|nr:nicotinate-nicotinamide nucleotide adenylyltransferase [Phycisphaerae bacterium]